MRGIEEPVIQAGANLRLGLQAAYRIERFDMRLCQVAQHAPRHAQIALARRIDTQHVAHRSIDVWFVNGNPEIAQVAQALCGARHVAREVTDVLLARETTSVGKPERFGKVVQRDHRFDMAVSQIRQHGSIAIKSGAVPTALARFNTAPLQAESQRVMAHLLGQGEIAFGSFPPVHSIAAAITGVDVSLLLPAIPLVQHIAALVLIRRGSRSPQKSSGKAQHTLCGHNPLLVSEPGRGSGPMSAYFALRAVSLPVMLSAAKNPHGPTRDSSLRSA